MVINNQERYIKPDDVLVQELDGEAVLLSLGHEFYYGLDEVGFRMYQIITTSDSLISAYEILLGEYEVVPTQLQQDFEKLVNDLLESNLIVKADA